MNSNSINSNTITMKKIWDYISNLGVREDEDEWTRRTIMLSNKLNFVMLVSMSLLLTTIVPLMVITHDPMSYGTLRVAILLCFTLLNLAIAGIGLPKISRLLLIFMPPVIFLLGPTFIGYVEEESYTYYPYILVCTSVIPQLLLHPKN